MTNFNCLICADTEIDHQITVKDYHLGNNAEFTYALCKSCGSLQRISDVNDLWKYYPNQYFSLSESFQPSPFLKKLRNKFELTGKGLIGRFISKVKPHKTLSTIKKTGVNPFSKILDVGSGSGEILQLMREAGFTNLMGVDPFILETINLESIKIHKNDIHGLKEKDFDLVMFHHSLEHTENPLKSLKSAYDLLNAEGKCLIRIPKLPSYGWGKYEEHWLHIDAPRHFFVPSIQGMKLLAKSGGYTITAVIDDMNSTGIWGSEQYLSGVSLIAKESYRNNRSVFGAEKINEFDKIASKANKKGMGDTAAFILNKNTQN